MIKKIPLLFALLPVLAACYGTTYQQQIQYVATTKKSAPVVDVDKNIKTIYLDKNAVAVIPHFSKNELSRMSSVDFVNKAKNDKTKNMFILEEARVYFRDMGPDWAFFNLDVDNDTFQISAYFSEAQFEEFNSFKVGDTLHNLVCEYQKSGNPNFVAGIKCHLIRPE